MHHAFLYISVSRFERLQRESAKFHVLSRTGAQDKNFLFLFQNFNTILQNSTPKKIWPHLTNYTRWKKGDKVWDNANSLFKWRFRSRRRRCCLSCPFLPSSVTKLCIRYPRDLSNLFFFFQFSKVVFYTPFYITICNFVCRKQFQTQITPSNVEAACKVFPRWSQKTITSLFISFSLFNG